MIVLLITDAQNAEHFLTDSILFVISTDPVREYCILRRNTTLQASLIDETMWYNVLASFVEPSREKNRRKLS